MKILLKVVIILSLHSYLFAQNGGNIWYFGDSAGIDFNGSSPIALTNGAMFAYEGCSSICDYTGNLLFYTNGVSIWNNQHVIMPNGDKLNGLTTMSQSAIIVKQPGINTIFYVFTNEGPGGLSTGLSYSEVDISMQNGLGDVNSNKNIPVVTPTCEKLAVVKHKNNMDYWIVTHLYGSNTFHSYLLSSTGPTTIPVVSNVGSNISSILYAMGYLKASPDGSRIAAASGYYLDTLDLFYFDNSTGKLNDPIQFHFDIEGWMYGVEFSPDGNLLYVSLGFWADSVYQFNLLAGSSTAIDSSRTLVGCGCGTNFKGGALQLGPDNKIYQARWGESYLSVIENPNTVGVGCNFNLIGLSLGNKLSKSGLPAFVNSIYRQQGAFMYDNLCFNDSTMFQLTYSLPDSVLWNFGDINSGINNSSKTFQPKHLFTNSGTFAVTLITYLGGIPSTYIDSLVINPLPSINLGNDTIICFYNTVTLNAGNPGSSYLWSTGETTDSITCSAISDTIKSYYMTVTNNYGCWSTDSITISFDPCVSIEDIKKTECITFFPNPATKRIFISKKDGVIIDINIYNQVGQKVLSKKLRKNVIDLSTLDKGIYIIEMHSNEFIKREKLVISHSRK